MLFWAHPEKQLSEAELSRHYKMAKPAPTTSVAQVAVGIMSKLSISYSCLFGLAEGVVEHLLPLVAPHGVPGTQAG